MSTSTLSSQSIPVDPKYTLFAPEKTVKHAVPSGDSILLFVYLNEKQEQGVLCDICGDFRKLDRAGRTSNLASHRGRTLCFNAKDRKMKAMKRLEEEEEENRLHNEVFFLAKPDSETTPLHLHESGSLGDQTLTPRPSHYQLRQSTHTLNPPGVDHLDMQDDSFASNLAQRTMNPTLDLDIDSQTTFDPSSLLVHSSPVDETNTCTGQLIKWEPGSIWSTYAYSQHELNSVPWEVIGHEEPDYLRLRSLNCKVFLPKNDFDLNVRACGSCQRLANSKELHGVMNRAQNAPPHTPWQFLSSRQLCALLVSVTNKSRKLETQTRNQKRKINTLQCKFNDHKRNIMLLAQNKIAGVSHILSTALRKGVSPQELSRRLENAINGTYRPRKRWSSREMDVAFLVKALGGPRLLFTLQKEEGYPSQSSLRSHKTIPELIISNRMPSRAVINSNISSFLGEKGRVPPSVPSIGQVLMIDGIALEEVCRYDEDRDRIVGLCREHSPDESLTVCNMISDIDRIANGLLSKAYHHGKDGTVVGIAPVTGRENYYVLPLVLSGSCKSDTGKEMALWIQDVINVYNSNPSGCARHGAIHAISTDGESSFRNLRYILCTSEDLDRSLPYAHQLYQLPGLNMRTGPQGLIGTSDPKHIVKRFATKLRTQTGIQLGDTLFKPNNVLQALMHLPGMSEKKAKLLLDPADKQNVPKAVNLLQSLNEISISELTGSPSTIHILSRVVLMAQILCYFLHPFIKVKYSLSQQIHDLSVYSHLLTALYKRHRTAFITSALFADSQSIIKNILFTVARLQSIDPNIEYHILFEGTDRLEGIFSNVRTQDHARNFDILQLAQKLSIAAEINAIFERHSDLNQGHLRRNLINARGVDHINPKSWIGNVRVGDVDLSKEYLAGRTKANDILLEAFGSDWYQDWDKLFADTKTDHLCPFGGYKYVGYDTQKRREQTSSAGAQLEKEQQPLQNEHEDSECHGNDETETDNEDASELGTSDDDSDGAVGSLEASAEQYHSKSTEDIDSDPTEFQDARDAVDVEALHDVDYVPEPLNPTHIDNKHSTFLIIDGTKQHKSALVAARLASNWARKVTTRPLHARGVTVEESVGRKYKLWEESESIGDNDDNNVVQVKAGDLGAFLVYADLGADASQEDQSISQKITLAVGEVLNFRYGKSKDNLARVPVDDLSNVIPSRTVSIAVQVLDLIPYTNEHNTKSWSWSHRYVPVQPIHQGGPTTDRHFSLRIPGALFQPLGPSIVTETDSDERKTWSIYHADLEVAFGDAWEAMNPDTTEIYDNLELLSKIGVTSGFPYALPSSSNLSSSTLVPVFIQDLPELETKSESIPGQSESSAVPQLSATLATQLSQQKALRSNTKVLCKICGNRTFRISEMYIHVGMHILRWHQNTLDNQLPPNVEIGFNPCGYCGMEGCQTQLNRGSRGALRTTSDCDYHYPALVTGKAASVSDSNMKCSNVPLHCPICPPRLNGQCQTFWKYNLIHHMTEFHLVNGELPQFPTELRHLTTISQDEEQTLGIGHEETTFHRVQYGYDLYSDPAQMDPDESGLKRFNKTEPEEESGSRKRTGSSASHASSASRRESASPSKSQRRVY